MDSAAPGPVAILLLAHGLLKLLLFTLPCATGHFQSTGFPGWIAYVVTFAELGGGAALIFGFYSRYVALAFVPELLGTIFLVHGANG